MVARQHDTFLVHRNRVCAIPAATGDSGGRSRLVLGAPSALNRRTKHLSKLAIA